LELVIVSDVERILIKMKHCRTCGQKSLIKVIGGLKEDGKREYSCINQSCDTFHGSVFR